jgi:flagellar M-ring protein FliF
MLDQLKRLAQALSIRQRILIIAAALAAFGGVWGLSYWNKERDFKELYSGLAADDAGAIVVKLRETGTEFRIQQNGGEILAPSAKVAELRLQMASAGLPKSGRIGYEIFDKTNFGQTDFAEQVNYRRALEGELERSVIAMQEIEQARVHIAFAKESMFTDSKQPAKASVLVKLKPGVKLAPQNVDAITHLISSAVESLQPEHVSVVDSKGKVLAGTPQQTMEGEASDRMLEYKKKLEQNVLDKVNATLEPLLGAQRFRAGVTAECDFTSGEQSEETLDPNKSVMVTSQRSEDTGTTSSVAGVPGTQSNLPRPAPRPASGAGVLSLSNQPSRQAPEVAAGYGQEAERIRSRGP